jgi:hypothetical protein
MLSRVNSTPLRGIRDKVLQTPLLGRALMLPRRARTSARYFRAPLGELVRWLLRSREATNFTYDLLPRNRRYLAALLADVTGTSADVVEGYFRELEEDTALARHVATVTAQSQWGYEADPVPRFGRRIGWYALVRLLKPRVVVETGVDKGLGACVLTSALRRNEAEGFPGEYFGTDINPRAGYLLKDEFARPGRVLVGDSIASLEKLDRTIDLFVNDSNHSVDYEAREYDTVAGKLSDNAVILGDNAHFTDRLLDFARATDRNFVFFKEEPRDHWYPGAGIGIAFRRGRSGVNR